MPQPSQTPKDFKTFQLVRRDQSQTKILKYMYVCKSMQLCIAETTDFQSKYNITSRDFPMHTPKHAYALPFPFDVYIL